MPPLRKPELLEKVLDALRSSGWCVQLRNSMDDHPLEIDISRDDEADSLIIYIWNITHGGATRSPDEYRIQITGVTSPLRTRRGAKTLLLGWYEDTGTFVAFDPLHRQTFGYSPSAQVSLTKMREAQEHGLSLQEKTTSTGEEIVASFLPDYIDEYLSNIYSEYHKGQAAQINQQERQIVVTTPLDRRLTDAEIQALPTERRHSVSKIKRAIRDRKFRVAVKQVYEGRCAICGLQAELTEAAHIVPVRDDEGTDEVVNGILLCRNHHKAYDKGMLAVDENFTIRSNQTYIDELRGSGLDEGLDEFIADSRIGQQIHLPQNQEHRPNRDYLRQNCQSKGF